MNKVKIKTKLLSNKCLNYSKFPCFGLDLPAAHPKYIYLYIYYVAHMYFLYPPALLLVVYTKLKKKKKKK